MPEGPSIVILKELVQQFEGSKVTEVRGNTTIEKERALHQKVIAFKSWGKHFLICFRDFAFRIHFLLYGSYRINEEKDAAPRLCLRFKKGVLNFYSCSVKIIDEPLDTVYDWSTDIMSGSWDPKKARKKLVAQPSMYVCDALLDQSIFSGSGNIIKNEILFRLKVHPLSRIGSLPPRLLTKLVTETRKYAFEFLEWKKKFELRKHWLAHNKKICPRCGIPFIREHLGTHHRRTFFCTNCQVLYDTNSGSG